MPDATSPLHAPAAPEASTPASRRRMPPFGPVAVVLGLFAAVLVAVGFAWRGELRAAAAPLRIAINPWPGYEFASLAGELGYFEDEGLEVRLLELSSLGDARRAFERGQADGFFGTAVEVVLAGDQSDRDPRVVLVVDASEGADVILARTPIRSMADLRGRRVAVESGSLTALVLHRALQLEGMAWSDVDVVHHPTLDMPAALAAGRVDAVVAYPPASVEILAAGTATEIFSSRRIPGEIIDVLAFSAEATQARAADIAAFARAFHRAQAFAAAHPERAYAMMAARQRITSEAFRQVLESGIRIVGAEEQDRYLGPDGTMPAVLRRTAETLRLMGAPDEPPAPPVPAAAFAAAPAGEP